MLASSNQTFIGGFGVEIHPQLRFLRDRAEMKSVANDDGAAWLSWGRTEHSQNLIANNGVLL